MGSADFWFWARLWRRRRFENPVTEPKRSPKPKRPLSVGPSAQRYNIFGNALTMAHLDFGWLVATTPLPKFYDEALTLLGEFMHGMFPVDQYRECSIRALILANQGHLEQARGYARIAIQAAFARHSGFRYHQKVGLVESPDKAVFEKLQALLA